MRFPEVWDVLWTLFFLQPVGVRDTNLLSWTHPDSHEAISEYNPREQEDKGLVATEERWHVCGVDLPEGLQVQVIGEDPQQAKGGNLGEKNPGAQTVIPEKLTALPVQKHSTAEC